MNLHEDENYKHEFCIYDLGIAPIYINFSKIDQPIDSLKRFLANANYQDLEEELKIFGVNALEDIEKLDISRLESKPELDTAFIDLL